MYLSSILKCIRDSDLNSGPAWSVCDLWEHSPARPVPAKAGFPLTVNAQALNNTSLLVQSDIALTPVYATIAASCRNSETAYEETRRSTAQTQTGLVGGARWRKEITDNVWQTSSGIRGSRMCRKEVILLLHLNPILMVSISFPGTMSLDLRNNLLNFHSNSSKMCSDLPLSPFPP